MSETKQAETRATAMQVNFFREMAMEYLRDWSDNYMRHAELAIIDWDGVTAEFHLANFAARARQQTAKEIAQRMRMYARTCGEQKNAALAYEAAATEIEREYEVKPVAG